MSDANENPARIGDFRDVYSPVTLLGVYASALRTPADARIILSRGVYHAAQNTREYGGYYFDTLRGVNDAGSIRLRVPGLLRSKLEHSKVYVFRGYVEKRVSFSSIELIFTVDDVLRKEDSPVSEEDQKRFSLMQRRITRGTRDFESMTKRAVHENKPLRLACLYGSGAIVNKDFERGLGEAVARFAVTEYRCNFSSKTEIIRWLRAISATGTDATAVVRGGGEGGLEIFNDPDIGAEILSMSSVIVTALGHAVNETLVDKLADRKFDLPHHFGSSLKAWVDEALEEQARSKSRFIEQVKTDLEKTYAEQILSLKKQVEDSVKERAEALVTRENSFNAQLNAYQAQLKSKDETLETLTANFERTLQSRIAAVSAEAAMEMTKLRLKAGAGKWWLYLLAGLAAGLIAGVLLK